jgi:hypothetical protein
MKKKLSAILATGLVLVCMFGVVAMPTAAFADPSEKGLNITCVGFACTSIANTPGSASYSWSSTYIYDTSYSAVTQQVNTNATEIIGLMQGGTTLYDQTFNGVFADTQVQTALVTAQGVLTGSGATSFIGPTLLSDSTSLVGSIVFTGAPVVGSTADSAVVSAYIGPQTIMIGDNQLWALTLLAGQVDFDTVITYLIHQTITTTTTDTYLTKDVYELVGVGVPAPTTSVPEPATLLLVGFGLMGLAGVRRKFRK